MLHTTLSHRDLNDRLSSLRLLERDPDKADTDRRWACTPSVRTKIRTLTPIRRHYFAFLSYGLSILVVRGLKVEPTISASRPNCHPFRSQVNPLLGKSTTKDQSFLVTLGSLFRSICYLPRIEVLLGTPSVIVFQPHIDALVSGCYNPLPACGEDKAV